MAFIKRDIRLTFQLGKGSFGQSGMDTLTVSGLRTIVNISEAGGDSMGQAQVRVYGMKLSDMNTLSSIGPDENGIIGQRYNNMTIEATDENGNFALLFKGMITISPIDMNNAPDTSMVLVAHAGVFQAIQPIPPSSYKNPTDAADIMQDLTKLSFTNSDIPALNFENNGVSAMLATPYYDGSHRDQCKAVARDGNFNFTVDRDTLAIWPKNGSRGGDIPEIGPDAGLIGYPTNWGQGVAVECMFNPSLKYGGKVKVKSSLAFANGTFTIFEIGHNISCELPDGPWFSSFHGSNFTSA